MLTTRPTMNPLPAEHLAALRQRVAGPVLTPADHDYAVECATFNLAVEHQPQVVVGATSAEDVALAVRFAAAHGLPVTVVATGHQAIVSVQDGLLINTGRMIGVSIDPDRRTALVGAGTCFQQVVDRAAEHGLAPLTGSSPLVGVVGFTLGGGLSPTMGRAKGWAADHVTALEVVTANGEPHRVTPDHEPDLYRGLLGGKSNFGVVTAMEFGLFAVDRLYAGGLFFSGEHAGDVLRAYAKLAARAPDELTSSISFLRLPPLPFVPEPLRGTFTVHVRLSFLGRAGAGEELIGPLRAAAPVLIDTIGDMPYSGFAAIHADPVEPAPFLERSALLRELSEPVVANLLELAGPTSECPIEFVELRHLGGALGRAPKHPNSIGHREAEFGFWMLSIAMPGQADERMHYADQLLARLAPWSTGGKYLNFMATEDVSAEQVHAAYGDATYARLRTTKSAYDPHNLFRYNHNIPPED